MVVPGVCIALTTAGEGRGRFCSGSPEAHTAAPSWSSAVKAALSPPLPKARELDVEQRDPASSRRRPFPRPQSPRLAEDRSQAPVRGRGALAVVLLIAFVVMRVLLPVAAITEGLPRLEAGERAYRIGPLGAFELASIAAAVDALASTLQEREAARSDLTRRILQVEEDERALARDLHDEFGQCLATLGAYAGSTGMGTTDPAICEEAGLIGAIVDRMSATLREALVRLRSQAVADLGLEAAFREFVGRRNAWRIDARSCFAAKVVLKLGGDLSSVSWPVAVHPYRIGG